MPESEVRSNLVLITDQSKGPRTSPAVITSSSTLRLEGMEECGSGGGISESSSEGGSNKVQIRVFICGFYIWVLIYVEIPVITAYGHRTSSACWLLEPTQSLVFRKKKEKKKKP